MASAPEGSWLVAVHGENCVVYVNGATLRDNESVYSEDMSLSTSEAIYFTVVPDDGYRVLSITVNGSAIESLVGSGLVSPYENGYHIPNPANASEGRWDIVVAVELIPSFTVAIEGCLNVSGKIRAGEARAGHVTSAAAPDDTGLLWIDTNTKKLKYHNGSSWVALS